MNYPKILQGILDIGEGMVKCGAEMFRVEDSLYRICMSYGFKRFDVFTITSNLQITVETPDGEILTQIRHIDSTVNDYDKLDYLNNLSRYVCANTPDAEELQKKYAEVMARPGLDMPLKYASGVLIGTGFSVFFGGSMLDAFVGMLVSILVVGVGNKLSRRENNVLVYNTVLAFLAGLFILVAYELGLGDHPDSVMIGMVMLLISGVGFTTGIREILQRDFISGFLNVTNAFLGALGIATGIAIAMLVLHITSYELYEIPNNFALQLLSSTLGCIGFAVWYNIKEKQIVWAGIGACLTWVVYAAVDYLGGGLFMANMIASMFVAASAVVLARINRAPSTIFLTASSFPLIPGAKLYYMMYGFVIQDYELVRTSSYQLIAVCLAIAAGFLVIDVVIRNLFYVKDEREQLESRQSH